MTHKLDPFKTREVIATRLEHFRYEQACQARLLKFREATDQLNYFDDTLKSMKFEVSGQLIWVLFKHWKPRKRVYNAWRALRGAKVEI